MIHAQLGSGKLDIHITGPDPIANIVIVLRTCNYKAVNKGRFKSLVAMSAVKFNTLMLYIRFLLVSTLTDKYERLEFDNTCGCNLFKKELYLQTCKYASVKLS